MELSLYTEIYYYLTADFRPFRFAGRQRKEQYKSWKRNIKKRYEVVKKDEEKDLTLRNSMILRKERNGTKRITIKKTELKGLWEKFHCDTSFGGHQGL
jgi:hypothetical protein